MDVLTSFPVSRSTLPRAVYFATSRPANHAICSFIDSSGYASGPIRRCLFIDYIIIENTLSVSFDIKITRHCFENTCLITRHESSSNCVFKAEPGKLDIKRRKPGILFVSLLIGSVFKVTILT